jgi:hypothetical protein
MRFLQRRTELGDDPRSGRPANSDLTQVIAELIRESPFRSCKICRHLRVSNETCLRFLGEKLGLKMLHLLWVPHQLTRTEHESLKSCHVTSTPWNTPALPSSGLCEFLDWDESEFFLEYPHDRIWDASRDDKNWHRKVHDFDHLAHFWNPQSTCISPRYEIQMQFSALLSACYSGYPSPAKHLLIEPQNNIE